MDDDAIPKNQWLIKIDTDQIYEPKKLYKSLYLAQNPLDVVSIPRLDFIKKDDQILIRADQKKIIGPIDHWLIFNDGLCFIEWIPEEKTDNCLSCASYEILRFHKPYKIFHSELSSWHFPFNKKARQHYVQNHPYKKPDNFKLKEIGYQIDPIMLDSSFINEHCKLVRNLDIDIINNL